MEICVFSTFTEPRFFLFFSLVFKVSFLVGLLTFLFLETDGEVQLELG